mmetsp:Transcript_1058/g.4167  ORF Transcript_1058/g.4167 Transcript_1058/m.4167 type:complete len:212 (-) Transcript_1058:1419-2054(-)
MPGSHRGDGRIGRGVAARRRAPSGAHSRRNLRVELAHELAQGHVVVVLVAPAVARHCILQNAGGVQKRGTHAAQLGFGSCKDSLRVQRGCRGSGRARSVAHGGRCPRPMHLGGTVATSPRSSRPLTGTGQLCAATRSSDRRPRPPHAAHRTQHCGRWASYARRSRLLPLAGESAALSRRFPLIFRGNHHQRLLSLSGLLVKTLRANGIVIF